MMSLTSSTLLAILRSMLARYSRSQSDMLPAAGTPERESLIDSVKGCLGLTDTAVLSDASITLEEWADALSERGNITSMQLFDSTIGGAFSHRLQRRHRYDAASLLQEADALEGLLTREGLTGRSVVSWLSAQTAAGFMLGALLPQLAGWSSRSLFDHANALWELKAGDIMVTSADRWGQLAQRLPSLPMNITAISTSALDRHTYRALLSKGVAHIIELHCQPGLGVLAARFSRQTPFELLAHWHPTESDDYLLKMVSGRIPEEARLAEPLRWVGARHFLPAAAESSNERSIMTEGQMASLSPAWQLPSNGSGPGASAA